MKLSLIRSTFVSGLATICALVLAGTACVDSNGKARGAGGMGSGGGATGGSLGSGGGATGGGLGSGGSLGGGGNAGGGSSGSGGTLGGAVDASSGGAIGTGGVGSGAGGVTGVDGGTGATPLQQLQSDYVNLRFGMFIHFGILTFCGSQPGDPCPGAWAQANLAINNFNPTALDPGQWADAAVSAKMQYGVLTTKHHDGFALWPSKASNFNVGHVTWQNGQGDVVKAYTDAFRGKGLLPGLYYSIYDTTQGVMSGSISAEDMTFIETQLTELLSNYGPIPILVIDGWSWQMGHNSVPYQRIYNLVKSLQPSCLITDHTHLSDPWEVDIVNFEEPSGVWAPSTNVFAAQQEQKVNASGGNDWFWAPNLGGLMTWQAVVTDHLKVLEPLWTNFLLNCPPNRAGTLDAGIVSMLKQVGQNWSPNAARPSLPTQMVSTSRPYTPASATATSGTAANAIDGHNDVKVTTMWSPTGALPQSVTLDLGVTEPDVGWLGIVPSYKTQVSSTSGNITSYSILTSTDGTAFTEVAEGTWPPDARMHVATFAPVSARYVRFTVVAANGSPPSITELSVGGYP